MKNINQKKEVALYKNIHTGKIVAAVRSGDYYNVLTSTHDYMNVWNSIFFEKEFIQIKYKLEEENNENTN